MPSLGIQGFDGVVPRTSPTALGERQAQQAENVRLYSGELRNWRGPTKVFTPLLADVRSIYKHINAIGNFRWLTWATDVDVVPGPSADTTDIRLYYTGDGAPKKTNYAMSGSGAYQPMGVPAPTTAPTVTPVSGTNPVAETRAYVYTYVNTFGSLTEESAPSPASAVVTLAIGQVAQLSGFAAPPTGGYNWTALRIYRSTSGSTGANYAFVAEVPLNTTTYTDTLSASQLGSALTTLGWAPPPNTLKGLVSMAGGVLAGFVGNTVYFSEPYFPYAWPVRYALNVPHTIVGLGSYGSSLVVMTDLFPYVITGATPGSMSVEKVPVPEPCVSKRSIAVDELGVIYASPNGLVAIGNGNRGLVTTNLFRRDEWQEYAPNTIIGAVFEGQYFGFFQSPDQGNRCMVLSRADIPALSFVTAPAHAAHVDGRSARLYYADISDNCIYEADSDDLSAFIFQWRSKRFVLPRAVSFSSLRVDADYGAIQNTEIYNQQVAAIVAANQALWASGAPLRSTLNTTLMNGMSLNGSILGVPPPASAARSVQVLIYGENDTLITEATLRSMDPVRIPAFKSREYEIKLAGNTPVRSVRMATTAAELRE